MGFSVPPIFIKADVTQNPAGITQAVTANGQCGVITTASTGTNLATNASATFVFNNSYITADSAVYFFCGPYDAGSTAGGAVVVTAKGQTNGSTNVYLSNAADDTAVAAAGKICYLVLDKQGPNSNDGVTTPPVFSMGSVAQATNQTTGVELNESAGLIATQAVTLAKHVSSQFTLTNSKITASSCVFVCVAGFAGTATTQGIPQVAVSNISNGSCRICISNCAPDGAGNAIDGRVMQISFLVM